MTTMLRTETTRETASARENLSAAEDGSLALLEHPVARQLLQSTLPARLAYLALDGTPRVVPILFHWTGEEIVLSSWPDDPKVAALRARPRVALTIDTSDPPFRSLSIRGTAAVALVAGPPAESLPTFIRYFGPEQGRVRAEQTGRMSDQMARIAVRPSWVGVADFETRFPRGMARRMGDPGTRGDAGDPGAGPHPAPTAAARPRH